MALTEGKSAALEHEAIPEAKPIKARLAAWTVLEDVEHDGCDWVQVRTQKGALGYLSTSQARSLLD